MPVDRSELDALVDRCRRLAAHAGTINAAMSARWDYSAGALPSQRLRRLQLSAVEMVLGHSLLWLNKVGWQPGAGGQASDPGALRPLPSEELAPFSDIGEPINALTEETQQLVHDMARFAATFGTPTDALPRTHVAH